MGMGYKNYHWLYNWVGMTFWHFANFGTCPASREFGICQTYVWQLFNYFKSLTGQVLSFNMTSDTLFLWLGHINYGWVTVLNVAAKWKEFMSKDEWGESTNSPGVGVGGPRGQKLCLQWQEPIPWHQAEKAFCIFELSTGWQIISEYTVERDHCNVTCWSMCV